jgi:hypothetical protein
MIKTTHWLTLAAAMTLCAGPAFAAPVWVGATLVTAVSDPTLCEAKLNDLLTTVFHPKLSDDPIT